ncbi:MAG TPA: allophanate hydrolase [Acidimicrobiales bacterium]|nr:allophanate hydrolase [Acidimicrobiales bacterium]
MGDPDSLDAALGSLAALRDGLAAARWSPTDVAEAVLARRGSGQAAAWIDLVPAADLRDLAAHLTAEGARDRPLWGVPVAVKGNIDVAGLPTTAGCPGYATGPAPHHAHALARLVEAGAMPVGTTNLDQFATGLVGTRSPYGTCHAVGRPGWVSGGSSSGSAVVVAQGDVPVALSTDTAGSGRVPAALNGIAGHKPTRGRISAAGVVPACRSLDCVGAFAATPADAALVCGLMAGPDPDGAGWWQPLGRPARVGIAGPEDREWAGDEHSFAAQQAAEDAMRRLGWELVPVDLGTFRTGGDLLYGGAFVAERFAAVGDAVRRGVAGLDPVVASIIEASAAIPAWRAFADLDRIRVLRAETAAVWDTLDALALPVVPTVVSIDEVAADPLGPNQTLGTYTSFANLFDLCASVAPVAARGDGHPWGVQLLAPAFGDGVVAALAQDLSVATTSPAPVVPEGMVGLVVAGAHLRGEALDHEVVACGGTWAGTTRTASRYALHLVADSPPRPGLVDAGPGHGAAIEVDVWALPPDGWARFVATGVPGLAVGRVELDDGRAVPGFVAAASAVDGRPDLTPYGGWRAWRAAGSPR